MEPVTRFDETSDATSTIALFQQLEQVYAVATWIYVICDNARYDRSKAQDYIKDSRIKLVFLPPDAPHLNLIERLWKLSKKKVLYNKYYELFDGFRKACADFFSNPGEYQGDLRSLLTENFEITGRLGNRKFCIS